MCISIGMPRQLPCRIYMLSWRKADQKEKEESKERDLMKRCQDAESKEGTQMKGVQYRERVTVNPLSVSPVKSTRI